MRDPMNLRQPCRVAIAAPPFLLAAAPASADHVMGGRTPSTFLEGLLSGLAHPVIGPEHLGFLIVGGVAIGAFGLSRALPVCRWLPALLCAQAGSGCLRPAYGLTV